MSASARDCAAEEKSPVLTSSPPDASETDNGYLLPSDDQLNYFVEKLCENVSSMEINLERQNGNLNPNTQDNSKALIFTSSEERKPISRCEKTAFCTTNNSDTNPMEFKPTKSNNEKRSLSNNDLNIAIMQCTNSLELLAEKRKSLEFLVQKQHNVANIRYNFSYSPRLPDSPTRVDRLMFDISRERCRILGLISALEKTMCSFSCKNTKDSFRKLLVSYGNAIVEVIKERQSEVAILQSNTVGDYDAGVLKLVELIGRVNRMNRAVLTALWCIEIKEQVGIALMRTRAGILSHGELRSQKQMGITIQKSWQCLKAASFKDKPFCAIQSGERSVSQPVWVTQQTSVYQIVPQKNQNLDTVQLYSQEQRAEVYQQFYSSLQQST